MDKEFGTEGVLKLFFELILLISLLNVIQANAETRHYKWEVKYEYKSPDCYKKLAITINGETPGPTIYAQQGDIIMVELMNSLLTENIAIHWHGIRQIGSPWFDGSDGVSHCPVIPGETFVYKFVVDKIGTYMYHAHYGMQRVEGFYGSILVAALDGVSEPFSYDYDRSIILSDWYHTNSFEQATKLSSIPFVWVGDPQSILIQGRGMFGFFREVESGLCNNTNVECFPYVLPVVYGKTYRLRIGCLTSLLSLSFEIEGHTMTVIEADGNYVDPFVIKNLYIYSGETYSVLIKADQDPSRNYWATAKPIARNSTTPMGLAIFSYNTMEPTKIPITSPPIGPIWNDVDSRLAQSITTKAQRDYITPPTKTSDRVIVMLNTQNLVNGQYRWSINNVTYTNPHTPYIIALKYNLTSVFDQTPLPENYDSLNYDIYNPPMNKNAISRDGLYRLEFNSTVDIVLQNANTMINNNSETHPWHLHGHDFWVIGYGIGKFDINKDPNNYNLVDPVMKNTVVVHPYGWTAIRFLANNPGVWSFHCHIEPHYYMGMGVVFEEGVNMLGDLPNSIMGCGVTKGFNRG